MAKPGRKSEYDFMGPVIPGRRPDPPKELEPDQRDEWTAIVARLPDGWFTSENLPMLKELCRHISYARALAGDISEVGAELRAVSTSSDPVAMGSDVVAGRRKVKATLSARKLMLMRAHGYQSERIGNLSTKLRLTQGSRATLTAARAASAANSEPAGVKPWLDWQNDREQ